MSDATVISADSHVQEPPELYDQRVPKRLRHLAPRIEERDGARYLIVDGKRPRRQDIAAERAGKDDQNREFRNDPLGGRDISRRLADMASDGISAEVIYPNTSLFLYVSPNPDYQLAVAKAYNDWAMELFGPQGERFLPVAIVPVADVGEAVAEVWRVAGLGYRSAMIPITVEDRPYNLPDYEPLWGALADSGLVLALHAFTEDTETYPEDWGEAEGVGGGLAHMAMAMARGQNPVALLISSGVLERHPNLNFVVVECGGGWLAWLLHVLDEQNDKKHMWIRPRLELKPSEYFRRQGHLTFTDDPVALNNIPFTGADCLLWGSDYPHDEGSFPHSQEVIRRTFAGLSAKDTQKIIHGNAARLYRLDGG